MISVPKPWLISLISLTIVTKVFFSLFVVKQWFIFIKISVWSVLFAAHFCIWLSWVYLQHVSVFGCVGCICRTFLYLQHVSVFDCAGCICSTFLYLIVLRVFAARFCI